MSYLPFKKSSSIILIKQPCTVHNEKHNECCSVLSLRYLADTDKFTLKNKKQEGSGGKWHET